MRASVTQGSIHHAVRAKAGPLGTHIDMLHMSPLCMGIAWDGAANVYWTFDGGNKSIVKYDFKLDHGMGNDDHSDGEIFRYVKGQLGYEKKVPSHLFYAPESKTLYIADAANGRIVQNRRVEQPRIQSRCIGAER